MFTHNVCRIAQSICFSGLTWPIDLAIFSEQMFTRLLSGPFLQAPSQHSQRRAPAVRRLLVRRLAGSSLLEALAAPHGVDRYLELVLPSLSLHDLRAEIVEVRRSTPTSVTLRLRPNEVWQGFQAGQFVSLAVEIDGVRRTRCYSPASSQHAGDGELELTIRAHAQGLVSQYLRDNAHPGMVVELAQAGGDFVLPPTRPERLLLISGGSGVTPVMSMLRTLCDEGHEAPVTFLHYARHERDVTYRVELEELAGRHPNVQVVYVYTREAQPKSASAGALRAEPAGTPPAKPADRQLTEPDSKLRGRKLRGGKLHGHLTRGQLRAVDSRYREAEVYVCGPPGLIEATRTLWAQDGHEERVHSESFLPPRLLTTPGETSGSVRFAASGVETPSDGITLLEQAEQAGLAPAYGCRMGICHTCTCRKLAGTVRNINSGELSSYEEEEIQICVSVPAGDVELDL
jgi:stearoyl-CoA 9-desaturase NADPH oxidoreductase